MKNLKKACFGAFVSLALVLGGVFTSCSDDDPEEDENLVVEISNDSEYIVTITPPREYADKDTYILYTTDGSEPSIEAKEDASVSTETAPFPVGWKVTVKGDKYESPFASEKEKTIKAIAYYYDSTQKKAFKGTITTYTVDDISNNTTTNETAKETIPTEAVTFKMTSSGNSNSTKYFDTANSSVFKYGDKDAYYQIQFSWKGTGKGSWYLYMREVGGGIIPPAGSSNKFISNGTYTGSAFDLNSKTEIQTGDAHKVTLKNSDKSDAGTITIDSDKTFSLKVVGVTATSDSDSTSGSVSGTITVDAK